MGDDRHAARVRGLLELARTLRGDALLPEKLARVAETIAGPLGFAGAEISLHRPAWDDFEVVARHGAAPAVDDPSASVPLHAADGELLGLLAVDRPAGADERDALEACAAHAAQAIESAHRTEAAARHQARLEQMLEVSSRLAGTSTVDSVLQGVCEAARDALGFGLAVIELVDRGADRYRPVASVGLDVDHADVQLDVPTAALERLFAPEFEREGCFLLERDEALERVGAEPTSYASSQNGRGARAWNRHWLVTPWRAEDGSFAGFIWVDDPADRLLPDRAGLQALRMLANHAATALAAAARYEALRAAEELHRSMLAASPAGILLLGVDGRVRDWNDAARRMFGYADDVVLGHEPPWIPAAQLPDYRERFAQLLVHGRVHEDVFRDRRADGRAIDVRTTSAAVRDWTGAVTGIVAVIEDITEQLRESADLERRNSELEALHETTIDLVDRAGVDSTLERIVAQAGALLGSDNGYLYLLDRETDELRLALGRGVFVQHESARLRRGEGLAGRVWETGETLAVDDYAAWSGSAGRFAMLGCRAVAGVPLRFGDEVVGVLGVAHPDEGPSFGEAELALLHRFGRLASLALHDATLYEDLRASRELYRTVVDSSRDMILLLDIEGRITFASPSQRELLGYEEDELIGKSTLDVVHPDDVEAVVSVVQDSLRGGPSTPQAARVRHRDGRWIDVEGLSAPVLGDDGRPIAILGVVRDIAERRRAEDSRRDLEDQLRQSQKMEAIGQLAGGIAHDFNNLLTAIAGYGDLALARLAPGDPVRRNVEEMRQAGERASALTRQLLAYSRKQVLQPKVLRLNEVVEGIEGMLSRLLGERVELSTELDPELGWTRADPGQVEQVLMNLAINARDAMPDGGRLTIETANVEVDEHFARQHVGATPGAYVMLAVRDTGEGIDRETLARVFDPFFTTKPTGQGTGLGLSTVYGIVKQTGGQVIAFSEPGLGTTFKVFLPRIWERAAAREDEGGAPAPEWGARGETVLLVEDEDVVRTLVHEMLEADGYSVLAASSGADALAVARAHPGSIDLLLTDVVMPGLSGPELAARLLAERPDVRVLFTSGYTEDAIANHGVLRPGAAFLEKPFSAPEVSRTLRSLLDGGERAA